jgi:hypothetical protein
MMGSTQGYRKFVAYLSSHCAELSEPEMVGVSGASAADQTRLRCHKLEVRFIAMPARFADRKLAFLDFGCVGLKRCWKRGGISAMADGEGIHDASGTSIEILTVLGRSLGRLTGIDATGGCG